MVIHQKGHARMYKQVKMGAGAVAGLAALALGGSAIASANQSAPHHRAASVVSTVSEPAAAGRDTDNVQSGDQTAPDSAAVSKASELNTSESSSPSDGPGGHADPAGNVDNQSGDQTAPDTAKASEASSENATPESSTSENSAPSDGPGGHADPAGNVDNQQQGQN